MKLLALAAFVPLFLSLSCANENQKSLQNLNVPIAERLAVCSDCSADAVTVAGALSRQGFQCAFAPVDSDRSYRCRGPVNGYPQPVNIFLPPQLNVRLPLTLAYHLHGWWRSPEESPFFGENGDYAKFLAESKTNTVLIIPESTGKNETYVNSLNTADRWSAFLFQVEARLAQAGLPTRNTTPRLLSAHSGAYVTMGWIGRWTADGLITRFQSLRGVALLDSAYGYRTGLVQFMDILCSNEPSVYMITYNPNEGGDSKRETNQRIYGEVSSSKGCTGTQIVHIEDIDAHNPEFPRHYLAEFLKHGSN